MEETIIRKMRAPDYNQVHRLVEQVNELHLNAREDIYKKGEPLNHKDFIAFLNDSKYVCYVAEKNDIIVGEVIAILKEIKEEGIFKHRLILFIEDICIDINYRRKGIGKLLYNKLLHVAKKQDVESIELNVWAFNNDAIKFYEKLEMNRKSIRYEYKI